MPIPPADLDPDRIAAGLTGTYLAGAPEGSVVVADHQSAGRGRSGRSWAAPPGAALLTSILFRPRLGVVPPERIAEIPMAVALAAVEAIERCLPPGTSVALKWPNDVLADGAKIGGLLADVRWPTDRGPDAAAQVVVGIGINVHQLARDLPPGATSLAQRMGVITLEGQRHPAGEGGDRPDRARLAIDVLNAADRNYADLLAGTSLVERWSDRLATLGQEVVAPVGAGTVRGRAVGVTGGGALVVETEAGERLVVWAGDVLPHPT